MTNRHGAMASLFGAAPFGVVKMTNAFGAMTKRKGAMTKVFGAAPFVFDSQALKNQ